MNDPIGPEELPPNLVRKCVRCNDFTGEMTSVVTTTRQQIRPTVGLRQTVGRDYRFTCTKCGARFMVPGAETLMSLGAVAAVGMVFAIGAVSQGVGLLAPIGLFLLLPLAWGFYQRKKHPGMF
jgi:hypothetical protein